ncbi:MAG: type II and III secretion system protein family protein, partial [Nitratireductor sp.]|nr:type II and III secretion system protein family protein [Nitratireductor sp.]
NNKKANVMQSLGNTWKSAATAFVLVGLALATPLAMPLAAQAEESVVHLSPSRNTKTIQIPSAQPRTFRADASFSEIVVGDPEIAVVTPLTDRSFYVVGSKAGTTGVALYNEAKELVGMLDIEVGPDTAKLNRTIADTGVKAQSANGRVVLTGKAKSPSAAAKARNIAKQFDEDVVDSSEVNGSVQVQLEVRFVEAQRVNNKEIGASLYAQKGNGTRFFGGTNGAVTSTPATGLTLTNSLISGSLPFGNIVGRLLDAGMNVDALVHALETRGVARRLAEPNLVALSGDTASFLAGGEFPVPVSADNGKVTVEFKKFGVGLDFTPTVLDSGLINLQIAPEVSQIDPTSSVKFNDIEIPGLVVRRAKTTVELRDGQSFVMAGLLQSTNNYDVRKFPWLGDIPILGALFRSSSYRKQETDLVIIVTPRLVRPMAPGTRIATPLDASSSPNDVDLFLNGKTEISRANLRRVAESQSGSVRSGHIIDF